MIISIPTQAGMFTFCLNAALLKLLASVLGVLLLITGYATMQFAAFILTATPVEFLRIVIFVAFLTGILFIVRLLLRKKAGAV